MASASNSSAVLDVTTESKEISTILREKKENDTSSIYSNSTIENSLVQSPSIESFSTLPDTEILSELNMEENSDLYVRVDNPQKHLDTLETYITFRITTKVARIEFEENEYIARRRYNDFIWLRQKLVECHPFCIVPPLPGKHTLIGQLDRYSKEFILIRMQALNIFMARIVDHPILSCNEFFKTFITANQSDFMMRRKHRSSTNSRISSIGPNMSSNCCIKNRHIEFEKMKEYLATLSEKLSSIEKISARLNKERHDYIAELNSFHPIFMAWSTTELQLSSVLQNVGNAIEKCAFAQNKLIANYSTTTGAPIREFLTYIDVVQHTLHKREAFQHIYEHSMDELSKRRCEKDKLMTLQNSSQTSGFSLWKQPSCDEKLEKLGTHIPQLVKRVETHQDNLECANESLRSDLERWQQEKQQCIKKILLDFVNKQIEFYETSVTAWETATNDLTPQNVNLRTTSK